MVAFHQRAEQTEAFLKGKKIMLDTIKGAYTYIEKDLRLSDDAPGGHVPFRRELSRSFVLRFFHARTTYQVEKQRGRAFDPSATDLIERPTAKFLPKTHIDHRGKQCQRTAIVSDPIHRRSHSPTIVRTFSNVSEGKWPYVCATQESTERAKGCASCAIHIDVSGVLV